MNGTSFCPGFCPSFCQTAPATAVEIAKGQKNNRTLIYTTIALLAIAVLLIGLSRVGTGLAYLPSTRMTGFAFLYHFAAVHIFFLGVGIGIAALGVAGAAIYKSRNLNQSSAPGRS